MGKAALRQYHVLQKCIYSSDQHRKHQENNLSEIHIPNNWKSRNNCVLNYHIYLWKPLSFWHGCYHLMNEHQCERRLTWCDLCKPSSCLTALSSSSSLSCSRLPIKRTKRRRQHSSIPLPSPISTWREKAHVKTISPPVIANTELSKRNNINKAEIDFICSFVFSRRLSGTRCQLLFSGPAWGTAAKKSDTVHSGSTVEQTCVRHPEQSFSD